MKLRLTKLATACVLAIGLAASASARVRIGIEAGSTRLGGGGLAGATQPLFDDATAEYVGLDVVREVTRRLWIGGSLTVSESERGGDARIVSGLAQATWSFRPGRRLQPHVDVSAGYSYTHNRHLGVATIGEGLGTETEVGLRIGLASGRSGIDVGWSGLGVESRGDTAANSTIFLGWTIDVGRAFKARHPPER